MKDEDAKGLAKVFVGLSDKSYNRGHNRGFWFGFMVGMFVSPIFLLISMAMSGVI